MSQSKVLMDEGQGFLPLRRAKAYLTTHIEKGGRHCDIILVSPSMAQEMLTKNGGNRPITAAGVKKYSQSMLRGDWKLTAQGISFSKSGRLIDGQHRLNAVIQSGVSCEMTVWFGCEEGEFDLVDQGRAKTSGDIIGATGEPNSHASGALAALILRIQWKKSESIPNKVIKEFALSNSREIQAALRQGANAKELRANRPSALAFYMIAEKCKTPSRTEKLSDFWVALCSGANLSSNSPILRLRKKRIADRDDGETLSKERCIKIAASVILAWNAFLKNKRVSSFDWPHVLSLPEVD